MNTLEQLQALIQTGTEAEVREFVTQHFDELPVEMQQAFAVEMFKEAMATDMQQRQVVAQMKKDVVATIDQIEAIEQGRSSV